MLEITEVDWVDSNVHSGWNSREGYLRTVEKGLPKACSVGYLFYEDDAQIVLAQSLADPDGAGDLIQIPKAVIIRRRVVKEDGISREDRQNADEEGQGEAGQNDG